MDVNTIKKQSIVLPNGKDATAIFPSTKDNAKTIIDALELKSYKAIILILGGADNINTELVPKLNQLFGRGIAKAAGETEAIIIDGGTKAGVMAMIGDGVNSREYMTQLIGVAPLSKINYSDNNSIDGVSLEPNHSHFILVEGKEWGSETGTIFNLIKVLSGQSQIDNGTERETKSSLKNNASKIPVVAILASGGMTTKNEVLFAVRQNIPLIVVQGSGGFADEISQAWEKKETPPDDSMMAEIIADGKLHFYALDKSVNGIERLIIRELGTDKVLMQAWETFADYDLNANEQQRKFEKIQKSILIVGVIGTALAISQQVWGPKVSLNEMFQDKNVPAWKWLFWSSVYYTLILIPILLTILITAITRFKQGSKWLLLRAGAESIKREIYRYRTRANDYIKNSEPLLSQKVEDITRRTMRTEVNLSSLQPYNKDNGFPPYMFASQVGDDGFSYLTPDCYVEVRLNDQLNYFRKKSVLLEKQLKRFSWGTFIIGGIGTFVAAIGQQVWIALTTSVVAAMGTYLSYRQVENTLIKYNQAATDLANVKAWWNALSAEEQAQQTNIDSLVEHTEQVLQSELDGWVQQMQNALEELRKEQESPKTKPEETEEMNVRVVTKNGTSIANQSINLADNSKENGKEIKSDANTNKLIENIDSKSAESKQESQKGKDELDKNNEPDESNLPQKNDGIS
jgi:hypothetical protein